VLFLTFPTFYNLLMAHLPLPTTVMLEPTIDTLYLLVKTLNRQPKATSRRRASGQEKEKESDYLPVQMELYRLIDAWKASGPNVAKLLKAEEEFAAASSQIETVMVATTGPRARIVSTGPQNIDLSHPHLIAWGIFTLFLLNPWNEQLGGPCAHCGQYFVKTKRTKGRYCSSKCYNRVSSRLTNEKRRNEAKERQVAEVIRFQQKWCRLSSTSRTKLRSTWREWVQRESGISKHFITRALREGLISDPADE
jgi:hypothetical protein